MLTIVTDSPKKPQKRKTKILNLPVTQSESGQKENTRQNQTPGSTNAGHVYASIASVIRRLPVEQAQIHDAGAAPSIRHYDNESAFSGADIYVKVNSCFKKIRTKDIYLIEGLCDYINIYTLEKRYTIYSTMYGILEKLPKTDFMRVHRSYIVRIDRIVLFENDRLSVEMRRIPVSKTYKKDVIAKLTSC